MVEFELRVAAVSEKHQLVDPPRSERRAAGNTAPKIDQISETDLAVTLRGDFGWGQDAEMAVSWPIASAPQVGDVVTLSAKVKAGAE